MRVKPRDRERIFRKVEVEDRTGCWLWCGGLQTAGYGQVWIDGTTHLAHRIVYELCVGPIPDGLQIDHLCRTRRCVNPNHVEPVTSRENSARSPLTVNSINRAKTHCPLGHPFDRITSKGRRECTPCHIRPPIPERPSPGFVRRCREGHKMVIVGRNAFCFRCATDKARARSAAVD